jgi:hypothetical protein
MSDKLGTKPTELTSVKTLDIYMIDIFLNLSSIAFQIYSMEFPGWNAYMKSHNFVHIFAASKFTVYFSDKIFRLLLSEAITLSEVS